MSQKVGSAIGAHVVMWSSHRPVQDLRAFLVGKTYAAANRGTTAAATTEAIRPIAADHRPCLRGAVAAATGAAVRRTARRVRAMRAAASATGIVDGDARYRRRVTDATVADLGGAAEFETKRCQNQLIRTSLEHHEIMRGQIVLRSVLPCAASTAAAATIPCSRRASASTISLCHSSKGRDDER